MTMHNKIQLLYTFAVLPLLILMDLNDNWIDIYQKYIKR